MKVGIEPLRLLIVEEQQAEVMLLQSILAETGVAISFKFAKNEKEFIKHVTRHKPDAIISGTTFTTFDFKEELVYLNEQQLLIPFILISSVVSDEVAQEYYKMGVDDFLTKFNLLQLPDKLHKAIEKKRLIKEHSLSEEVAKINKDRIESIFDNSPDCTFELGMKGELIRINSVARQTLQVRPDNQLRKAKISDFVLSKDNKTLKECLQAAWRGHQKELSFRVESHKGNIRWLAAKAIPLFDEEKLVSSVLLICNDLTEQKETEKKLKKTESSFLSMLASVQDSIWSVDQDLILEYFNEGLESLHKEYFGVKIKSGMSFDDFLPIEKDARQHAEWKQRYERALAGETVNAEDVFGKEEASRFFYSTLRPIFENGHIAGVSVIRKDITELTQALKEVRDSEVQFRTLSENSPVGIFRADVNGKWTYVNKKWCDLSGLTSHGALENGWKQAIHPDDRESVFLEWTLAISEKRDFKLEYRIKSLSSNVSWVLGNATALKNFETNEVAGYIGTISDITDVYESRVKIQELDVKIRNVQRIAKIAFWEREEGKSPGIWSKEMFELWEFQEAEVAPEFSAILDRVHFEDRKELEERWTGIFSNKRMMMECRLIFPDGRTKYILTTGFPISNSGSDIPKAIGTVMDITPLKEYSNKLAESEQIFKTIFNNSPDAYYVHDRQGDILDVNLEACFMQSMTREELIGKNIRDITPASHLESVLERHEEVFKGNIVRIDGISRSMGGEDIPVDIAAIRIQFNGKEAVLYSVRSKTY